MSDESDPDKTDISTNLSTQDGLSTETPSFKSQVAESLLHASKSEVDAGLASSAAAHEAHRFLDENHPQIVSGNSDYIYSEGEYPSLRAYAAASCLGHSSDAWSYFAQATRAVLAGEFAIAKHLLYYSELRSAFSLLSRHGILIRSKNHVVLQDDGTAFNLKGANTHTAVWIVLKAWAKTGQARDFFLNGLSLDGQPLSEWLDKQGSYANNTMAEVFSAIGYDLNRFSRDQAVRNGASYGARWLGKEGQPAPIPKWFTEQLTDLWALLDPIGNAGFESVDIEFAGHAIMEARKEQKESVKRDQYLPYARDLAKRVGALQVESTAERLVAVAERAGGSSLMSLAMTRKPPQPAPNVELLAMVARAFLLARFSSAASADLIQKSAVPESRLDFWFANAGIHTGLWSRSVPMSALDVLEDIKAELALFDDAESASDLFAFLTEGAGALHKATSFGLMSVWIRENLDAALPVAAA